MPRVSRPSGSSRKRERLCRVTGALGPERVHVELWRIRARLAAVDGDLGEAARLAAEADAAARAGRPVGVIMGGQAELMGFEVRPQPLRAGEPPSSRRTGDSTGRPGGA